MTIVETIKHVTEWAERELCSDVKFKKPPENLNANDANYDYQLVTPKAFSFFIPQGEMLQDGELGLPCVCVRLSEGTDNGAENDRKLNFEMVFATWSPGYYKSDMFTWMEGGMKHQENASAFQPNGEGWLDAWNWVDKAVRKIESSSVVGGLFLDYETPVTFGPMKEQEEVVDFYPFWYAWVRFSLLDNGIHRNMREQTDFF